MWSIRDLTKPVAYFPEIYSLKLWLCVHALMRWPSTADKASIWNRYLSPTYWLTILKPKLCYTYWFHVAVYHQLQPRLLLTLYLALLHLHVWRLPNQERWNCCMLRILSFTRYCCHACRLSHLRKYIFVQMSIKCISNLFPATFFERYRH